MSIKYLSLENTAREILSKNTPVLFCDTCALLDIIRLPLRGVDSKKIEDIISSVEKISDSAATGHFSIIMPPPVYEEWNRNNDTVFRETIHHCQKVQNNYEIINCILKRFRGELPTISVPIDELGEYLLRLCSNIIKISIHVEIDQDASLSAQKRNINLIAPAAKGSTNDSIVYEHALKIMFLLKQNSFQRPVVFLSPNSKDFCDGKKNPKEQIKQDLDNVNATFCLYWNWALSNLSQ